MTRKEARHGQVRVDCKTSNKKRFIKDVFSGIHRSEKELRPKVDDSVDCAFSSKIGLPR